MSLYRNGLSGSIGNADQPVGNASVGNQEMGPALLSGITTITLSPGTATATANALASTLDPGSLSLSAGIASATANALAGTIINTLQAGVASATANALSSSLDASGVVTLSPGVASATANALASTIIRTLNANVASATANALASTLSGTGTATLSPGVASATANALAASFDPGSLTVSAGTASANASGLSAALNRTLQLSTASATANALQSDLNATGVATISPGVASATANALSPTFVILLSPGVASATANALSASTTGSGNVSLAPGIASATANVLAGSLREQIQRTGFIEPHRVTRPELPGSKMSTTHTGAMQARNVTQTGFTWTEEYGVLRIGGVDAEDLLGMLESVYSSGTTLRTTHPTTPGSGIDPNGTGTGGVTVDGGSQKGNTINTTGWPASTSNVVVTGDVIKIEGFDRVFRIQSNADSDASGNATIEINPPLYESPTDGASITTTGVEFECTIDAIDNWPDVGDFYYDGLTIHLREQPDST